MKKLVLVIAILLIAFMSAFLIVYLSKYENSFNAIHLNWVDISQILEKWIQILGIVAIPVVLWYMSKQEQDKKDELINLDKERQIEKDRVEKIQYFFIQKVEPLILKNQQIFENINFNRMNTIKTQQEKFFLIMQDLDKYRSTIIDIIAHINKIYPCMTNKEKEIHSYVISRVSNLVENITTIFLNIFVFENLYFNENQEANMVIDNIVNKNKIFLYFFESIVIYGVGKDNSNDYKQAMEEIEKSYEHTIKQFTELFQNTDVSKDRVNMNHQFQNFIKKHKIE